MARSSFVRGLARKDGGFALVVVLAAVLMISLLVVGLLIMAENETKSAARYMDAADARLAADSVIQIVQGQIRKATTSGIGNDGKGTQAWASQPGALRVFDDSGDLVNIFKLYSSGRMVLGTAAELFDGSDIPSGWESQPDAFVDLNAPVSRNGEWIYPIASPEALLPSPNATPVGNQVVGFTSTLSNTGGAGGPDTRLAMPVRWMYVQKDGSMSTDPSVGDPVLRIAFWTDDESSKININTASATDAASYADIPRANFKNERDSMAWMQPAQNEFNRYPGHPATVSLSTVFPSAAIKDLIEATPRYAWGGSENATKPLNTARNPIAGGADAKRDRLYASPDEFLYGSNRSSQLGLNSSVLDARRFFLTASSRSSDLNLYGMPRVTIWPLSLQNDTQHRTPYDNLIAYCSTIGSAAYAKAYYFIRSNPLSQTDDWALPAMSRNREIFSYLRDLTAAQIPGFGGSFLTKYDSDAGGVSGERDQILTEIFDYIRCVNLNDTYQGQPANFVTYTTKMDNPNGFAEAAATYTTYRGPGFVLPIEISDYGTRGAGRVPVLSEIGIWLIQTHNADHLRPNPPQVQPALIFETFSPMQGFMPWAPYNFSIKVRNITAPRLVDLDGIERPLFADDQTRAVLTGPSASFNNGQAVGGIDGWAWNIATQPQVSSGSPYTTGNPFITTKDKAIPLASGALTVAANDADRLALNNLAVNQVILQNDNGKLYRYIGGGEANSESWVTPTIAITEGEFEISLMCDPNPSGHNQKTGSAYQTYRIRIPPMPLPVPVSLDWEDQSTAAFTALAKHGWLMRGSTDPKFLDGDVVRGIPALNGDFRTIAYLENVPSSFFAFTQPELPVNFYSNVLGPVHGFRGRVNHSYLGSTNGGYVNVTYGTETPPADPLQPGSWHPKISDRITDLRSRGWEGDFDNGVANLVDGPYLNKSDEGSLQKPGSNNEPYFWRSWWLGNGLFSPLRQVPSAVVFGSLPTSVKRGLDRPWRTLNFCPNPLAGASHFGMQDPPDYLLLDLFTMPVVEPYAISEPFSTAGRLNMNYQIVPFTYVARKTPMHAALAAQKVIAIADADAQNYKSSTQSGVGVASKKIRYAVDIPETLKQFDHRFDNEKDIFRSASEICSLFLVPEGSTAEGVESWWDGYKPTGNNSRERPYATLYPLLTTKSNVFTTHMRVQAIKRTPAGKIQVNGEYRGSVTFERFLDPNDPQFTDGSVDPDNVSLEPYFRFRTLSAKQFDL